MLRTLKEGAKATGEAWRDNYRTPAYIIDRVNAVFPDGWLDPCPENPLPGMDGLGMYSFQNRYVNPPFSQYQKWVDHWLYQPGEQIWICHTNNSSGWFKQLMAEASALCLLFKRVIFIDPRTGEPCKNSSYGKSQSVIYVGDRPEVFIGEFSKLGYSFLTNKGNC